MVEISELMAHKQNYFCLIILFCFNSESHDNSQPVHKDSLQTQVIHIIYTVPASWITHKEMWAHT